MTLFRSKIHTFTQVKFLVCSRKWTLVNLMMTLAGLAFGAGFLHFNTPNGRGSYIFYGFIYGAAPLFSIAVLNYVVLLYLKSCAGCCCGSFIERSGLDIDTFEVVDLEEMQCELEIMYTQKMFLNMYNN